MLLCTCYHTLLSVLYERGCCLVMFLNGSFLIQLFTGHFSCVRGYVTLWLKPETLTQSYFVLVSELPLLLCCLGQAF